LHNSLLKRVFKQINKLKEANKILFYIAMATDEKLYKLFKIYDQNKNGYIEHAELKKLLTALGETPSSSRVDKLVMFISKFKIYTI
jgi:Ca2+-binding EF-hand superfamily protein